MKAFINWSGGKDSAFCLYQARKKGIPVEALVTTVNRSMDRISMHGVRRILLEQQAAALQLPLYIVEIPEQASMSIYEAAIHKSNQELKSKGFTHAVSGDLFLEDLKTYREQLYALDGIEALFPIWKKDSLELLHEFWALGFKTIVVCINNTLLDQRFCGREIDEHFISELPPQADPCGENGEYHSFVYDGPIFRQPILFRKGEMVFREYPNPRAQEDCFTEARPKAGFYFCDLLPAQP